ncbi:MAG: hypothetical protein HYW24_02395 [Candidatus Aenigmarchaeota archaeon]|nr:hypothetical protein [Candidatus Aenigmarchaeota archaeon]
MNEITLGSRLVTRRESVTSLPRPYPREIERLKGVNLWGPTFSTYRASKGIQSRLSRFYHIEHAMRIGGSILLRTDEISPTETGIIMGILAMHDSNTTAAVPHCDEVFDTEQININALTGQGYFTGSQLPMWIRENFGDPEIIAGEIKGNGRYNKIAQSFENSSHIALDAMSTSERRYLERILRKAEIDLERGGLILSREGVVPPNYVVLDDDEVSDDGEFPSYEHKNRESIERARTNVLNAYSRNLTGAYYETVLLSLMRKLDENGRRLYADNDEIWVKRLSEVARTDEEIQGVKMLKTRSLIGIKATKPLFYRNYQIIDSDHPYDGVYTGFRRGVRRREEIGKKLGATIIAYTNVLKPEYIYNENGIDFDGRIQLVLGAYSKPDTRRDLEENDVKEALRSDPDFGPFIESVK